MKLTSNDFKRKIDNAFKFYNINEKYKNRCYECIDSINDSKELQKSFYKVYKRLYFNDFSDIRKLWNIKNINELFTNNVNPFITNIMILLGYEFHINNIKKYNLDYNQIVIHKKRVKECFENDIENRGYEGIRISQMLWAIYFIRLRIIEVGRLQYQYSITDEGKQVIKIHIPKGKKLDILSVKKSIHDSKNELYKIFKVSNCEYVCNSWLLSNQIHELVNKDTNIYQFQELFNIENGENCIEDILNFVYEMENCDDYSLLSEKTCLQRKIKEQLLNGRVFYLGLGILKKVVI